MKKESRVAVCCGSNPYVIVVVRGDSFSSIYITDNPLEIATSKEFKEVMFHDESCKEYYGEGYIKAEPKWRRLACLLFLLASLSKGNGHHTFRLPSLPHRG
ncbi:hypothetical protein EYM_03410 [Ignicoccus islandicus DSM 13165]|uniref:Uncharacterized protein n=1 Tax=Ignicoccus islandicus DSM 13165 TaxID=940295 RepID=A0A0U3F4E0_9CREN|nr:hypothetical protein EYM_03410 [Ignicoccus islandicus DSM 13165]